ncbi:hypothetical protein [Embleya sp. AB8]|uniref:hypothetical protein n=1 Tax=Embleya sp. AB8 TaxID=3156304 RepID=UPI003C746A37
MIVLIVLILFAGFSTWNLYSLWRNSESEKAVDAAYRIFGFRDSLRRGIVRAQVAFCGIFWCILIGFGASILGGDDPSSISAITTLVGIGVGVPGFVILGALIVVINRPRSVVPPHMRKDSGLLKKRPSQSGEG